MTIEEILDRKKCQTFDCESIQLNFAERMQLFYDKGERYYEDKDVYGVTIDDVDFITEKDGQQKVSAACILLFVKNPQRFFPRARTRFIRYEGTEEKVSTEMNVVRT